MRKLLTVSDLGSPPKAAGRKSLVVSNLAIRY